VDLYSFLSLDGNRACIVPKVPAQVHALPMFDGMLMPQVTSKIGVLVSLSVVVKNISLFVLMISSRDWRERLCSSGGQWTATTFIPASSCWMCMRHQLQLL
jgi:hypothetical protein